MKVTDIAKRFLDLILVLLLIPFAIPAILIAAIAIRMDGRGPIIFRQSRVGKDRKVFTLYKLRTMDVTMDDRPSHEASSAAITRIGHLLRRTKVDELPQLWNVLRGEMSFVGPRPCLPNQMELIQARHRHDVFTIRPGITGLAQVHGVDMSNPSRLARIDGLYLHNRCFTGDLYLLARTFLGSGRGDRIV